jgi:hypothetical protein
MKIFEDSPSFTASRRELRCVQAAVRTMIDIEGPKYAGTRAYEFAFVEGSLRANVFVHKLDL